MPQHRKSASAAGKLPPRGPKNSPQNVARAKAVARKLAGPGRPRVDPDLTEARRRAREQREIVKLTKRVRRDLAAHRRELRLLWWDLHRMFTGDFPVDHGEPPAAPNGGALADDEGPATPLDRLEAAVAAVDEARS